jgi:HK97 family phage major capsid protein
LILGDFRRGYKIVDRMGLELQYNPMVLGSNRRPTGEVAWVAFWRVGARAVDPNAFRMLRV